jgi:hypothetical protein
MRLNRKYTHNIGRGRKAGSRINRGQSRIIPVPLARLPKRSAQARTNALHVKAAMVRDSRLRLSVASRSFGVKPSVVKKYLQSSLEKVNGRWRVRKSDRFRETMYLPDPSGNPVPVSTRSSKERTQVSAVVRDIGRFYRGDKHAMDKWRGKSIAGVELVTDPRVLIGIESQLSDFSIYNTFNGGTE